MSKLWWKCAAVRSLKTICQCAVSMIPVGVMISEVSWLQILSTSVLAGVLSLLTSVAGLPEVPDE